MDDYETTLKEHQDSMTEDDQKKAGVPVSGAMTDDVKEFLKTVIAMIESGQIDPRNPQTILKKDVYDALDEQWKDKADIALLNIAEQLRLITDFYHSSETPDESPQLENMVEKLWDMKQRIEQYHDVFIF